jgi:zinc transport system substrate-binding protein
MIIMVRSWRLGLPLLLALLLAGALAGCGQLDPHRGQRFVVASFYPLAFIAKRIVGAQVPVLDLTHPGQDPHDVELTVRQTAEVEDATVAFYETGLQPAVDEAIAHTRPQQTGSAETVDAAGAAHLVPASGPDSAAGMDPHFWLDPVRASAVATEFERAMVRADPAHARRYARNLARLHRQLASLNGAYRRGLAHCRVRTIVVSHAAFGYLARRYHLHQVYINGLSPDAEPSPAHLRALQGVVARSGVTTIFSEPLESPAMADTLAHDLGLRTAVLDPIEGLSPATAHQNFLSLMRHNLSALEKAGRCA